MLEEKVKGIYENCPLLLNWDDCFGPSKLFCNINFSLMTFLIYCVINPCQCLTLSSVDMGDVISMTPVSYIYWSTHYPMLWPICISNSQAVFLQLLPQFVLATIFISSREFYVVKLCKYHRSGGKGMRRDLCSPSEEIRWVHSQLPGNSHRGSSA